MDNRWEFQYCARSRLGSCGHDNLAGLSLSCDFFAGACPFDKENCNKGKAIRRKCRDLPSDFLIEKLDSLLDLRVPF